MIRTHFITICVFLATVIFGFPCDFGRTCNAQELPNRKHSDSTDKFSQIDSWLPTAGETRTASGAPGPKYWQQRADYDINVTLDDKNQRIEGDVTITYHNRSPHPLSYLWIQLDQNRFRPDADQVKSETAPSLSSRVSFGSMKSLLGRMTFDGGYDLKSVTDDKNQDLKYVVNKTMMRLDLAEPLAPRGVAKFKIAYGYNIVDSKIIRARGGHEYFEDDKNYIYEIAQWYPRVAAYTDYDGWQNKQFLGRGEFTLEFGDYTVRITLPSDMVLSSTGTLQNADEVLPETWQKRLAEAKKADKPVFIVTPEEAKENEKSRSKKTKTWVFTAKEVRDFAFAASRKFIWDAMGVDVEGKRVMAMSFYPNEAEPLWSQYSTEAIVHTLNVYGRYSLEYPYPVAISVNGPVYGMEYPMICFNGPRPEEDGTYSKSTKYALISVIIHEVGHNFFPMIVNSDERKWTWMDEGLNTFLQFLSEQEWEEDYPSRRGFPEKIVPYMAGGNQRPIMTGSEEILQFGNNAYGKPATALNILRETIMGRELFDFAFRTYSQRWKFKRPTPADFFRTMEDASAVDLDWFWRGWFYSTDHVDIGIDSVRLYIIDAGDPDEAAERKRQERDRKDPTVTEQRNKTLPKRIDWQPGLKDFYNNPDYDPEKVEESDRKSFQKFLDGLSSEERAILRRKTHFYVVDIRNHGGLVMPVIVRVHYADSTNELVRIPAQIWRSNSQRVSKLFISDKEITRLELDPHRETADTNKANNEWPEKLVPSRFKLFKDEKRKNEMQKAAAKEEVGDKDGEKEGEENDEKAKGGDKKPGDKNDEAKQPKDKKPTKAEAKK